MALHDPIAYQPRPLYSPKMDRIVVMPKHFRSSFTQVLMEDGSLWDWAHDREVSEPGS